jgi:hypothetical protein
MVRRLHNPVRSQECWPHESRGSESGITGSLMKLLSNIFMPFFSKLCKAPQERITVLSLPLPSPSTAPPQVCGKARLLAQLFVKLNS